MHVGDKVTHVDFPGQLGTVVGKSRKWPEGPPTIIVKWGKSDHCSRHFPAALKRVG